jgi:hypothetical protein
VKDAVGGRGGLTGRYGNRADIFVNAFATDQHYTWRMVWVYKNGNNNAETGWALYSPVDQNAHPFKTWHVDGELRSTTPYDISLSQNGYHEFKTHDQNGDESWSFAYDGISLGNEYVDMTTGFPISESERNARRTRSGRTSRISRRSTRSTGRGDRTAPCLSTSIRPL